MNNPYPDAPACLRAYEGRFYWCVVECPICGRKHTHGGGLVGGDPRAFLGWRALHCLWPPGDAKAYCLVELAPERTERIIAAAAREGNRGRR